MRKSTWANRRPGAFSQAAGTHPAAKPHRKLLSALSADGSTNSRTSVFVTIHVKRERSLDPGLRREPALTIQTSRLHS